VGSHVNERDQNFGYYSPVKPYPYFLLFSSLAHARRVPEAPPPPIEPSPTTPDPQPQLLPPATTPPRPLRRPPPSTDWDRIQRSLLIPPSRRYCRTRLASTALAVLPPPPPPPPTPRARAPRLLELPTRRHHEGTNFLPWAISRSSTRFDLTCVLVLLQFNIANPTTGC
jgi:hypothetical protein